MKVLVSESAQLHAPPFELLNGTVAAFQDQPNRATEIRGLLLEAEFEIEVVESGGIDDIIAVHDSTYVRFVADTAGQIGGSYRYPVVWPSATPSVARGRGLAAAAGAWGDYASDVYTPIGPGTFAAALGSASVAAAAARQLIEQPKDAVYALCRPPGHHAGAARMGAYCYFNNAAIAASILRSAGKVGILDLDYHHGNGTQAIFYEHADVCTVSLHADPASTYPFYQGYSDECGSGLGSGANRNVVLRPGTGTDEFLDAVDSALSWVDDRSCESLVVAFGADTHHSDPLGSFELCTGSYKSVGTLIAHTGLPVLVVQEGGYGTALGASVLALLSGIRDQHRVGFRPSAPSCRL